METKGKAKSDGKVGKAGTASMSEELRSASLWVASRTLLAEHGAEFFSRWKKAVKGFQEDDIHDFRVASRRLREGLTLFSPSFPGKKSAKLIKQVRKVTRMLGDLRNTDEAVLFFSSLSSDETAQSAHEVEELLTGLRRERDQAHKRLKKELGSLDPEPLRAGFDAIRNGGNLFGDSAVDPFMSITSFAGGAIMERAGTLAELLPPAVRETESAAQHELRIAVKKMRYRMEILAPLMRTGYEDLHGALKGYQDVLGKLHDMDVFCQIVQERLQDGTGKEGLLRALADRRSSLYAFFVEMLDRFPIDSMGERGSKGL